MAALQSYEVLDTLCETAFDNIVDLTAKLTDSPIALVTLVDAERQWFKARHGLDLVETAREHAFCGHAIRNPSKTFVVPDARLDVRFANNPLVRKSPEIRFYAGAPLVNPEGMALGTLCILDKVPRELSEEHHEVLTRLAETVMTTLELRRAVSQLRHFATVDILTGLANSSALFCAVENALARQRSHDKRFSLLYLDLDGLKRVNDEQGHVAGDAVLREVAVTLTASVKKQDLASRLGGDKFAVMLLDEEADAAAAAERIRAEIERGMHAHGWGVTVSIGAVTFRKAPVDVNSALVAADAVMYGAKVAGKNRVSHRMHG